MERLNIPKPENGWSVDLDELHWYPWWKALYDCPQDPIHHAEGDVGTHTEWVLRELVADPAWRELPERARVVVYLAAVLHDVAKPLTTKVDDPEPGRVSAKGHSPKGAIMAREILWGMDYPVSIREQVCALIKYHQVPYFLVDDDTSQERLARLSQIARCDWLKILATADIKGRICEDVGRVLDNIALFQMYAAENGCLDRPLEFPDTYSRYLYFAGAGERSVLTQAYDDSTCEVIVMCGLPGSGKDTWIRENVPADVQVISMDDMRRARKASHGDKKAQGQIRQEALERARQCLRECEPFVWNATNLDRQRRSQIITLATDYKARVRLVHVEAPVYRLFKQNKEREHPIPEAALRNMFHRWEFPTPTEAHRVEYVVEGISANEHMIFRRGAS